MTGVGWTVRTTIVTPTTFQATEAISIVQQYIPTLDGVMYTASFVLSVEEGGQTTGLVINHDNSASGGETYITPTTTPTLYEASFLGMAGGGDVGVGLADLNTSNWALITVTDFQLTETSYRMPYVKTEAAAVTVPYNYTTDGVGYQWDMGVAGIDMPELWAALVQELGADEKPTTYTLIDPGWTQDSSYVYSCDGTQSGTANVTLTPTGGGVVVEETFKFSVIASGITAGSYRLYVGGMAYGDWVDSDGGHIDIITSLGGGVEMFIQGSDDFVGTIEIVSIEEYTLGTGQGELQVGWTPGATYDHTIADDCIVSIDAQSRVVHHKAEGSVGSYDGTTYLMAPGALYQAGVEYTIYFIWGTHPVEGPNKMQVGITDGGTVWDSNVMDFDGSFDPLQFFSVARNNEVPQTFRFMRLLKIPASGTWA